MLHRPFSELYHPSHLHYSEGPTYQHVSPSGLPGFVIALFFGLLGAVAFAGVWPWMVGGVFLVTASRFLAARQRPKRWLNLDETPSHEPIHPS